MSAHGELVIDNPPSTAVEKRQDAPGEVSIVQIIEKIAQTPNMSRETIDVLERLVAMQERSDAIQRERTFNEALARVQAKMPQLDQKGRIELKPGIKPIPYAKLEDIDSAIRPIYSAEGFAVAWNSQQTPHGDIEIIGDFKHSSGHSERRSIFLPADKSGAKNSTQSVISTVSYGKRALLKMFFNLVERGTDMDGSDLQKITQSQADDIRSLLDEVKADRKAFLKYMGVEKLEDILVRDHQRATAAIEVKRRKAR